MLHGYDTSHNVMSINSNFAIKNLKENNFLSSSDPVKNISALNSKAFVVVVVVADFNYIFHTVF